MSRHSRGRLPAARRDDLNDSERAQKAANLQQACGRWLVMWSPWRRTYTAFACFTSRPVIIDEEKADVFLARIKQVELASTAGRAA